jgi:RNA polymerase sigma-B factor
MNGQDGRAKSLEELWLAYAACPNSELREEIVEHCRPLALSILKRTGCAGDEDLEQVALLGLVKAVDRFDPTRGTRFSTFATPTILGEVRRYLRDHSRLVRPPRSLHDLHAAVLAKEAELNARLGRAHSLTEVAEALGVEVDRVAEAIAIEDACHPSSLSGSAPSWDGEQWGVLEEVLGAEDPELQRVESRVAWDQVLSLLDGSLRKVIELRYFQELTQRETAERFGVSQMQISRLEHRALERLRRHATALIRFYEEMPPLDEDGGGC